MHQDDPPPDDGGADEPRWGGMSAASILLPFAATVVSLVFGMFIGGAVVWIVKPVQRPIEYMRTASLAELQLVCEPVVQETTTELTRVRGEIDDLSDVIRQKEAIVTQLQEQLDAQGVGGPRLTAELDRAKVSLADARGSMSALKREKDELVDRLRRAEQALEQSESDLQAQVAITEVLRDRSLELKDDVIVQRWFRMITEAQLDICEKGGKRKTEECRQAVVDAVSAIRREFVHCVRSDQAAPSVEMLERGEALPSFARLLDQDDKYLSGYYMRMCDPTLPELTMAEPEL